MSSACDIEITIALLDDIIVTAEAGCDVDVFVELDNPIEIEIFNWPPVVDMLIERIAQVMEVGVEVFFRTTETHLQYKLKVGDWIDLIPLVDLKGDKGDAGIDGQEISIQKTTTHIQWRLGNGTWVNLVALADLKGDKGDAGTPGIDGADGTPGADGQEISIQKTTTHIQWRLGTGTWVNLVALADLKGDKGEAGIDGQEVTIQKTATHIQWQLGSGGWVNLIPLADLKGEVGADAPPLNIIEPSVIGVGGIPSGTTFNNITFPEFVSMLLYPELFPGLVSPSRTFTASVSGLKEVGEVIPEITFTSAFNRGQITPQYESESPYRSGLPSEYQFDHVNVVEGAKLTSIVSNLLSESQAISSYVVVIGVQSWRGRVSYSQGVQPKGSKGTNFDSPLVASTTAYITRSITGVYPCFASLHAGGIATLSKLTLAQHASVVVTDMAAEGGGVKQAALFPTLWGVLSKLEQYNELSGQWDTITLASFTQTSEPNFSYGSGFSSYNRYTHNGGAIGRRSLRWTFT